MTGRIDFHTETELAHALMRLVGELQARLQLQKPIQMFIAGGMAAHLYTASRVTCDVDAEFSHRFVLPSDLLVETDSGQMLYIDANYNSTFALMHENYLDDAIRLPVSSGLIELFVLSPVDLIVSKIARLSGPDLSDIENIIRTQKVGMEEIAQRATEALGGCIGNLRNVELNLADVLALARRCQHD